MSIAIITGASAGLGRSFFQSLLHRHPDLSGIWLIARRRERLEQLAADSPIPVTVLALDLLDAASYDVLGEKLKEEQASVRILINNAGVGELDNVADSTWPVQSRMVDLNCRALTAVTTITLPYMERGGFVLNVCSIASFCPNTRMTVYSSTKAYVMSFTKGLREELKPLGINALAVCPGPMKTEFLDVANITDRSKMFKTLPYSDPDRVADRAVVQAGKGRCVYTPLFLFKLYRVLAKALPHSIMMKFCKT